MQVPFKLTRELLEVMDSNPDGKASEIFDYFKVWPRKHACSPSLPSWQTSPHDPASIYVGDWLFSFTWSRGSDGAHNIICISQAVVDTN